MSATQQGPAVEVSRSMLQVKAANGAHKKGVAGVNAKTPAKPKAKTAAKKAAKSPVPLMELPMPRVRVYEFLKELLIQRKTTSIPEVTQALAKEGYKPGTIVGVCTQMIKAGDILTSKSAVPNAPLVIALNETAVKPVTDKKYHPHERHAKPAAKKVKESEVAQLTRNAQPAAIPAAAKPAVKAKKSHKTGSKGVGVALTLNGVPVSFSQLKGIYADLKEMFEPG